MVYNVFYKKFSVGAVTHAQSDTLVTWDKSAIKSRLFQTINQQKNYTSQLVENLKNENFTHLLRTKFGVLILQIWN